MLVHRVSQLICSQALVSPGDTVIVGTSGGADSTALLHVLHEAPLGLHLVAVYIDHGLRPRETPAERRLLSQLAKAMEITFTSRKVDVTGFKRRHGTSPEEAARILRYRALEEFRREYQAASIAVAHTADDQVEEFLLRLLRGAGLKGLAGMEMRSGRVIRPLLRESKKTLLAYLAAEGISCCHDSSNDSRAFLRNRIRHDLLPLLERDFNPATRSTLLQTTAILREDDDLLDEYAESSLHQVCTFDRERHAGAPPGPITISRHRFLSQHPSLQRRILEKICWRMESRPSFRTITALGDLIVRGNSGARYHLSRGLRVHREQDSVVFSYPDGRKSYRGEIGPQLVSERKITGPGSYPVPELGRRLTVKTTSILPAVGADNTLHVDAEAIAFPLVIRPAKPGEKMCPLGAPGRKKINRILSDLKIPAGSREWYPLLVSAESIIAILGLKIDHRFRVTPATRKILAFSWEELPTETGA